MSNPLREQIARILDDQLGRETSAILALFTEPSDELVERCARGLDGSLESVHTDEYGWANITTDHADDLARAVLRAIGESE